MRHPFFETPNLDVRSSNAAVLRSPLAISRRAMAPESRPLRTKSPDSASARARIQRDTPDSTWESARARSLDLKGLQDRPISSVEVDRLAKKWGVGRATVYRQLARYRGGGDLTALIPRRAGKHRGHSHLSAEVEFIVRSCAKRLWALSENATIEDIFIEIVQECKARQLPGPR